MKKLFTILVILLTGCYPVNDKNNIPKIWVDKSIPYRLHYGKSPFDFVDVRYDNQAYINGKFVFDFEDDGPIISLKIGQSLVQGHYIEIFKDKSHWFLCNFDNHEYIRLERN